MYFKFQNIFSFTKLQFAKLKRLKDSPHQIALGFSLGVWVNFIPIMGIHLALAVGLAFLFRSNILASLTGVLVTGLPLIFPFFWFLSWYIGSLCFYNFGLTLSTFEFGSIINSLTEKFLEMMVGSIILFPFVVTILYFPILYLIKFWRKSKSSKKNE